MASIYSVLAELSSKSKILLQTQRRMSSALLKSAEVLRMVEESARGGIGEKLEQERGNSQ